MHLAKLVLILMCVFYKEKPNQSKSVRKYSNHHHLNYERSKMLQILRAPDESPSVHARLTRVRGRGEEWWKVRGLCVWFMCQISWYNSPASPGKILFFFSGPRRLLIMSGRALRTQVSRQHSFYACALTGFTHAHMDIYCRVFGEGSKNNELHFAARATTGV